MDRTLFWRGRRGTQTWSAVRCGTLKYVRLADGRSLKSISSTWP